MKLLISSLPVNAIWRLTDKLKRTPSFLALVVQVGSLVSVWLLAQVVVFFQIQAVLGNGLWPLLLVLAQAVIASVYAHKIGMASWWKKIHFGFPIALYGMLLLDISNAIYLVGFLFCLTLYWTTFKTQVPFYPSRPTVWRAVNQLIHHYFKQLHQPLNIIEIGSGLGDFSMYLSKQNHLYQVLGIEIAPLPWLISRVRALFNQSQTQFKLGNYEHIDFSQHDVVFAYLSPAAMPALWKKANQEMRTGCLLISLEFEIPGITPTQVIQSSDNSPKLYVWHMT